MISQYYVSDQQGYLVIKIYGQGNNHKEIKGSSKSKKRNVEICAELFQSR